MKFLSAICALVITETVIFTGFLEPSNLTKNELQQGLLYELKPLAETFVEIEDEYGINSALFASVVAMESGWGRSKLSKTKNNITSYRCSDGFKEYSTKEECLWDMARNLSENYFSEDGIYYNESTKLNDVACYYLLGKPRSKMNAKEKEQVNDYASTVQEIYNGIIFRGVESEMMCAG